MTRFKDLSALVCQYVIDFWRLILGRRDAALDLDLNKPKRHHYGETEGDMWLEAAWRQAMDSREKVIYITADQVGTVLKSMELLPVFAFAIPFPSDPTLIGRYRGFEVRVKDGAK